MIDEKQEILQQLAEKYLLHDDEYDIYYTLECTACGILSYSSCVGSPEKVLEIPCHECGNSRKHKRKPEKSEPLDKETWDKLYGE